MLSVERRIIGFSITLFLFYFIFNYASSNSQGLIVAVVILNWGLLEYLKPWWGFYLFLLLWPSIWVIGELLAIWVNPYWAGMPWFFPAPLTTALSFACWLRFEKGMYVVRMWDKHALHGAGHHWFLAFRIALWGLFFAYFFSWMVSVWRLNNPHLGWVIPSDAKQQILAPILTYLPSLLLGLLLLNRLSEKYSDPKAFPHLKMIALTIAGGVIAAIFFTYQIRTGYTWWFNNGDPLGGPFFNRNTTAPFLSLIGLLLLAVPTSSKWKRISFYLLGALFFSLTVLTQSRNGIFMILCLMVALFFIRAAWIRFALAAAVLIFLYLLLFWLPLPNSTAVSLVGLSRSISSIESLRTDGMSQAVGDRWPLFQTAIMIFKDYPWIGSGPGTFGMLTAEGSLFGSTTGGLHLPSPHSIPLHLLAETGLLGAVSWSLAWVLLPFLAVIRWQRGNMLALTVLIMGLGNIFDTVWMLTGMTTLCVLLIVWACAEENKSIGR